MKQTLKEQREKIFTQLGLKLIDDCKKEGLNPLDFYFVCKSLYEAAKEDLILFIEDEVKE